MNKQTKKIALIVVCVLAIAGGLYYAFFFDRAPVNSPAQQAEQALTQSYKAAEEEAKTKNPKKAAELFAEPPAPTSPGGGARTVDGKRTPK